MSGHRSTRVAEAIKEEVATILLLRLKDVRVQSERVSVTNVEVTGDLRHATIFVSILGDEEVKEATMEGLRSASGFIRSEIGRNIKLRATPEVHIKLDDSLEHGANISALLNRINEERTAREAGGEG
ncbi:MAG: ribosome-binding factor [Cyanobacteria bacterium RYN_339]|nr:ribosome-binding factor [Cyanobacteria bacterium RYN_339]